MLTALVSIEVFYKSIHRLIAAFAHKAVFGEMF
jgi:hypothetical protein